MSVPAADSTPPIAVLVLAWDETTPAVRALVEATQAPAPTVESILVMVPQASHPDVLSAEEYLPLSSAPTPPPPPEAALPGGAIALPLAIAAPAATADSEDSTARTPLPVAGEILLPQPAPASLAWSAVRVLRLGRLSLAELSQRAGRPLPSPVWLGVATAPAAPYQGATATPTRLTAPALPKAAPGLVLGVGIAGMGYAVAPAPPHYEPAEPLSQGADLEADLVPSEAEELTHFELITAETSAAIASFEDPFRTPQASWAGALAALQQPAPAAPTPLPTTHAADLPTRPATPQYEVPDLNFRIIQYARFAVPVVLAAAPYAAIYAPAWPTWLAAQELRQRTGWPLVLHVTTLAAGAAESLATATGWMADLQRQALRRADVVLAETPALAQRLRHELDLPAGTVHAVHATDTVAIAQALHAARPRPAANLP